MRIGSVRPAAPLPPASLSSTTGTLSGICTRIEANVISIIVLRLPAVELFHVGTGVVAEGTEIARHHVVEVAVPAEEVEPVAEHELVRDDEAGVLEPDGHDAARLLVEQGAGGEGAWPPALELVAEIGQREAGVDDVLDEDDVPPADVDLEVLDDP